MKFRGVTSLRNAFPCLGDSKRNLDAGRVHDVAEVHEDALGSFGTEVNFIRLVLHGTGVAFKHEVEGLGFGEFATAIWTRFLQTRCSELFGCEISDQFLRRHFKRAWVTRHVFGEPSKSDGRIPDKSEIWCSFLAVAMRPARQRLGSCAINHDDALKRLVPIAEEHVAPPVIDSRHLLAAFAHGDQVRKVGGVAAGDPDFRVGDDGRIKADDIEQLAVGAEAGAADDVLIPCVFEVAFEFNAEGAVVPEAVDAAVDFGGGEDEAFAFAEGDDFFHFGDDGGGFCGLVGHGASFGLIVRHTAHWYCASADKGE